MSIIRAAENKSLPVSENLRLATLPEGPIGNVGPAFTTNIYVIWKFAQNIDGAKKFLVDYIAQFRDGFIASGFQNMPSFPGSVPEISDLLNIEERYSVLSDVPPTMTNFGAPGYSNAATDEVRGKGIIPMMFSRVATGIMTAEESLNQAEMEIKPIFDKWREAGKI
jgi:multiple sugar transport system substrate-binding protein